MAIDKELTDLMLHTVTIYPYSSVDSYGARNHGAGVEFKCHLMRKNQIMQDATAREDVALGRIITADDASSLNVNDLIEFTDGTFESVLSVTVYNDDLGEYHHATIEYG